MTDADAFGPLKPDIFHVLLALESGPLHGYGIIAAVEDRTDATRRLLPSLLYRRLARLVEEGLVREVPVPTDPDPRRKHYELTPLGRQVLKQEASRIVSLGEQLARYRWSES
ncbi:MAG: PadR family transcriptional regulator [Gemmatimonadota bacterium]